MVNAILTAVENSWKSEKLDLIPGKDVRHVSNSDVSEFATSKVFLRIADK